MVHVLLGNLVIGDFQRCVTFPRFSAFAGGCRTDPLRIWRIYCRLKGKGGEVCELRNRLFNVLVAGELERTQF